MGGSSRSSSSTQNLTSVTNQNLQGLYGLGSGADNKTSISDSSNRSVTDYSQLHLTDASNRAITDNSDRSTTVIGLDADIMQTAGAVSANAVNMAGYLAKDTNKTAAKINADSLDAMRAQSEAAFDFGYDSLRFSSDNLKTSTEFAGRGMGDAFDITRGALDVSENVMLESLYNSDSALARSISAMSGNSVKAMDIAEDSTANAMRFADSMSRSDAVIQGETLTKTFMVLGAVMAVGIFAMSRGRK